MDEKSFPKSRIITANTLIGRMAKDNLQKMRFCFILGSGASKGSAIPTGNELEKDWMDFLMGVASDRETSKKNPDVIRKLAEAMKIVGWIKHDFQEIEEAWSTAQKRNERHIDSKYYFDIYRLRFYKDKSSGYRYLEDIMEGCTPSVGYHSLSILLTKDNLNNLVITTNFDTLVEDALAMYTDKKPLVAGHESLAGYIEGDIRRPMIAKVHRGMFYEPFNMPEETEELSPQWQYVLNKAMRKYTPIVIGYGGGDSSLMGFLEDESTFMPRGIYWCYLGNKLPDERIQKLVLKKNGCFVQIKGFDDLMLEIGKKMFGEKIHPVQMEALLTKRNEERIKKYTEQWIALDTEKQAIVKNVNQVEKQKEKKREAEGKLTYWDYIRRGLRYVDEKDYEKAIKEYNEAINMNREGAVALNYRGIAYKYLEKYEEAIKDFTQVIKLRPEVAGAYNNRGNAYRKLNMFEEAIEDYSTAIEKQPNDATAYYNRGIIYGKLREYAKAVADYTEAIRRKPDYVEAYINRGVAYRKLNEYFQAIEDYSEIINRLDPNSAKAYNNRGYVYGICGEFEKAMVDINFAIKLKPDYAEAYDSCGFVNEKQKKYKEAIENYTVAIKLKEDTSFFYRHRAEAYRFIGEILLAEADEKKAEELEHQGK